MNLRFDVTKGRKPKPTTLKLVTGTYRKDRANKDEPKPKVGIPSPPDFLNADALQEWGRMSEKLYQLGMLAEIDRGIFAAYCQAFGRWAVAEKTFNKMAKKDEVFGGLLIKTKAGNIIQNPVIGIANKAVKVMDDNASLMGIPATMRTKVHPIQLPDEEKTGFGKYQTN